MKLTNLKKLILLLLLLFIVGCKSIEMIEDYNDKQEVNEDFFNLTTGEEFLISNNNVTYTKHVLFFNCNNITFNNMNVTFAYEDKEVFLSLKEICHRFEKKEPLVYEKYSDGRIYIDGVYYEPKQEE